MRAEVHPEGLVKVRGEIFRAALGKAGVRQHKMEGDESTPAGILPLRKVLFRADRQPRPVCAVPVEPLAPNEMWCDESGHRQYNRLVRAPFDGRHEVLWRDDALYDIVGVLGWNDQPVERGRGSAIFLHVARPDLAPTEGCIALGIGDLRRLLSFGVTEFLVLGG